MEMKGMQKIGVIRIGMVTREALGQDALFVAVTILLLNVHNDTM